MKVGFLPGDLTFSLNENEGKAILSTSYNTVPIWLKIGHDNLKLAKIASDKISASSFSDAESNKELLMNELAPSMQVFVSSGIALDALYETLRPHAKISPQELEAWKSNKTSRAKQIAETLRRTHKLGTKPFKDFRACIAHIIGLRDRAVHPSTELKNACSRSDIPFAVDWKFATYCFPTAEHCFRNTINMLACLYEVNTGNNEIDTSIVNIIDSLEELKVITRNKSP